MLESRRLVQIIVAALGLCSSVPASAGAPAAVKAEVEYLLGEIGRSACEFNRNGSWYDPARAQSHLRGKFDFLAASGRIRSGEDFIELVATKSSISGLPYTVRCQGQAPMATGKWLRDLLIRHRRCLTHDGPCAGPEGRPAQGLESPSGT